MRNLDFAIQLAQDAGELLIRYYDQDELEINLKADRSVVTQADLAADQLIARRIQMEYPEDLIISEELKPRLAEDEIAGRAVWVVDPLDGTANFSLGLPVWGVLVARLLSGYTETAVLYFPRLGELYTAQRGEGATYNGRPLRVKPPVGDRPNTFFSCCSRTHRRYEISVPYKPRILGSTGYNLCSVARGMSILSFDATPKIWDIAAAWLLVLEAGGVIEVLQGPDPFPLQAGIDYARQSFPVIAAATPELAAQGHRQITPRPKS